VTGVEAIHTKHRPAHRDSPRSPADSDARPVASFSLFCCIPFCVSMKHN
jgi:hypothetical protein